MCKRNGFTSLLLFLAFGLLLPCLSFSQDVQGPSDSANSSENIVQTAKSLEESTLILRKRLELRKTQAEAQVIYWQNIVTVLKAENEKDKQASIESSEKLTQAELELKKSQAELTEISNSLTTSEEKRKELSLGFESYKTESEKEIARLEKRYRFWSFIGKFALLVAAGEGTYIAINGFF